ncbi:hypothetical protein [Peribacillus deserti]|uniref:Uncharacterized protein n=1 Tax=Peribacillus deserti TaxID=673318 RepID=A0A2N5M9I4_9BACI|nr:hypothetical protein [Peribacillus deserti]PLT31012.1 hypothetical protein CUU66_04190 [Peribacillus deserti]
MEIPDELNLISVFASIPKRIDKTECFYYDKSTYSFENDNEVFKIIMSPFYQEFTLRVTDKKSNTVLSYLELLSVRKLEVVEDSKDHSAIRLFHGEADRFENVIDISFKPKYKIIFREQNR